MLILSLLVLSGLSIWQTPGATSDDRIDIMKTIGSFLILRPETNKHFVNDVFNVFS